MQKGEKNNNRKTKRRVSFLWIFLKRMNNRTSKILNEFIKPIPSCKIYLTKKRIKAGGKKQIDLPHRLIEPLNSAFNRMSHRSDLYRKRKWWRCYPEGKERLRRVEVRCLGAACEIKLNKSVFDCGKTSVCQGVWSWEYTQLAVFTGD